MGLVFRSSCAQKFGLVHTSKRFLTSCDRRAVDLLIQPNSSMFPRQSHPQCVVLESAPYYVCGRKFTSTTCRGLSIACSRTTRAVYRRHCRVLGPVIECSLSWYVVNDAD